MQIMVPFRQYDPANRCVYCFKTRDQLSKDLTLEHIIPFALEGHLEIPSASCDTCQKIINEQIEQVLLNDMFWNYRYRIALQSRGTVPENLKFKFADGSFAATQTKDYPRILQLPYFSLPTALTNGKTAEEPDSGIAVLIVPEDINKYRAVLEHKQLRFPTVNRRAFCRLLAKIAHSYVYAELGYENFKTYKPLLLPVLLCDQQRWWDYIGGHGPERKPDKEWLHRIGHNTTRRENTEYVFCDLQLFSFLGSPRYRIVVGERHCEQ